MAPLVSLKKNEAVVRSHEEATLYKCVLVCLFVCERVLVLCAVKMTVAGVYARGILWSVQTSTQLEKGLWQLPGHNSHLDINLYLNEIAVIFKK